VGNEYLAFCRPGKGESGEEEECMMAHLRYTVAGTSWFFNLQPLPHIAIGKENNLYPFQPIETVTAKG